MPAGGRSSPRCPRVHPSGYRYTQFCEIYRQWARRLRPSIRQVHRAGEKTFIDFSGKRPSLVDRRTGELRRVELFVAVLGASSLTYAEATETQQLPARVDAHGHMVECFGGATTLWVPDQLKSAITRPCRYEPGVNRPRNRRAGNGAAIQRGRFRPFGLTRACACGRTARYAGRRPKTFITLLGPLTLERAYKPNAREPSCPTAARRNNRPSSAASSSSAGNGRR